MELQKNYKEAISMLQNTFNEYPDARIKAYMAELEAKTDQLQNAIFNMEQAIALAPQEEGMYKKIGNFYKQTGDNRLKIFVNGGKPNLDVPAVIEEGRTLVPFRALAEKMEANVDWKPNDRKVTVERDGKIVEMTIGNKTALVNGEPVELEVEPKIMNGRTLVPIRFVGESLNSKVGYDHSSRIITVMPNQE